MGDEQGGLGDEGGGESGGARTAQREPPGGSPGGSSLRLVLSGPPRERTSTLVGCSEVTVNSAKASSGSAYTVATPRTEARETGGDKTARAARAPSTQTMVPTAKTIRIMTP